MSKNFGSMLDAIEDYPFCPPLSESLSALRRIYDCPVKMQTSTVFGNLKKSTIGLFHDADITEKLFSNCGVLEILSLEYCCMQTLRVLHILAPKLKKFTFLNLHLNAFTIHPFHGRLNMHTPNLVDFCYNGPVICWEFSNMSSVNNALLQVFYEMYDVLFGTKLGAMVSALNCAKALTLPSIVPQWSEDKWTSRNANVSCLSQHLKEVQITGFRAMVSLEFIKFILQNVKVLENIEISPVEEEVDPKQFYALQTVNLASKTVALSITSISDSGKRNRFCFDLENAEKGLRSKKMKISLKRTF